MNMRHPASSPTDISRAPLTAVRAPLTRISQAPLTGISQAPLTGIPLLLCLLALVPLTGACSDPPRLAKGIYRLPFVDTTHVGIFNSFFTHSGEYDMGKTGSAAGAVAAAAAGWIRFIEDGNSEPTSSNNYIWIEHPFPYCQEPGVTWPGKPANYDDTCLECELDHCNEWTKYSHVGTNSVTTAGVISVDGVLAIGAGLQEGDWVEAGEYLGVESNVGQASGKHVHMEVTILNPDDPITGGGFSKDWTNGAWIFSPNLLPYMCSGDGADIQISPYYLYVGDIYEAQPCPEMSAMQVAERDLIEEINFEFERASELGEAPVLEPRTFEAGLALLRGIYPAIVERRERAPREQDPDQGKPGEEPEPSR